MVAFVDITERKLAEAGLANVSRRLIEAHEQERTRIGRDLHDDVVQRLALLSIELEAVQQDIPDAASELRTRIGALRSETTQLTDDVQLLSHELHSSKLEYFGIVGAAKNFCKEFSERRRWKLISRVTIYLQACQPTCLFLCSEFYKKPYAMPRSIVG